MSAPLGELSPELRLVLAAALNVATAPSRRTLEQARRQLATGDLLGRNAYIPWRAVAELAEALEAASPGILERVREARS